MGDDITIGVTEIVNNIEVTAQPNDQIVDISVIDNTDEVTLNITPTVIEINVNKGSSFAKWGDILGTLSDQEDLQDALNLRVPYTGATGNVNLGEYGLTAGFLGLDTTPTSTPTGVGTIYWDSANRTAALIDGDGDTTLQIGQEQRILVHNNTGSTLTDGQVVYVTGSTGNLPSVSLANATSETTSAATVGVVTESIANGADGFITTSGIVNGLNTLAFNEGDLLWLSTTAGAFTTTKPASPAHLVLIGYVIKKAGGNGSILVKIQNTQELEESSDVLFTSLTDKDVLTYESSSQLWKNKSLGTIFGGTSSQFVKGDGSLDSNTYALTSQLHDAVTIGTANGLSLSTQVLSLGLASSSANGALSSTDWTTFNNKVESVAASAPLGSTGGKSPVISITQATTSSNGYLSSTDWNTFNGKQNALTNPITGTGTTNYLPKFTGSTALGNSLIFDNGTNVGIGATTAPSGGVAKLFLYGASGGGVQMISALNNGGSTFAPLNGGGLLFYNYTGALGSESYSEVMRITSGGNIGIGTTSPSAKLNVSGDIHIGDYGSSATRVFDIRTNTNLFSITTFPTNSDGTLISYSWANGGQGPLRFGNASSVVLNLTAAGNVLIPTLGTGLVYSNGGTLTSTNPSDSRLKNDITDLQYGLNEILQLRPVSYNWKDDTINQGKQFGFIAQEVQEVMPELVKEFETEDGERLGLDKEGIYAALVNAIKEQNEVLAQLKAEIEILKNK